MITIEIMNSVFNINKKEEKKLKRNLKLFYLFLLSQRRLYYAIIGLYFLMIPGMNENTHLLGWFISAGSLTSFIFEIPSGYFSDLFGHKKTLIISKIFLIVSTLLYIFANHWWFFLIASIFNSLGMSFKSGTMTAIFHNTLLSLGEENEYIKINSKMNANVSLISALLLILAPWLLSLNTLWPFLLALFLDIVGLVSITMVHQPKVIKNNRETKIKIDKKSIYTIFKESKKMGFLPFIFLFAYGNGIGYSLMPFREIYLQELGILTIYLGALVALSRITWFVVGHLAHKIEKRWTVKQIIGFEIFYLPFLYIIAGLSSNAYLVLIILAVRTGFKRGISSIKNRFFLNNYISNQKYKATVLSIKTQVTSLTQTLFPLGMGYLMSTSYSSGYIFAGILALVGNLIIWQFLKNKLNK